MTKKIIICVFCVLTLFGFFKKNNNVSYIQNILLYDVLETCVIVSENKFDKKYLRLGNSCTKVGDKFLIKLFSKNLSAWFDDGFDYIEFKLYSNQLSDVLKQFNLKILVFESLENKRIFYCYSGLLKKQIYLKNFKINFQIVVDGEFLKIGYPIIYTSF